MKPLALVRNMQIVRNILAIILSVAFVASEAQEVQRRPVNPQGPFAKLTGQITQVVPTDDGYGNGFIVGVKGCHLLTNFHVAFFKSTDPQTGKLEMVDNTEVGYTVNFAFDLESKTGKFKRTTKAKVVEFGNFEEGTSQGFLGDMALLRLETCLGKEYGQLEIDRPVVPKTLPNGNLMTVSSSRNASGKNEVLVEEGCRARTATPVIGMMLSNCEAVPGMSGSMILEEGADKKWRLAGISSSIGAIVNGKHISKAIYASEINKFLDRVPGWSK